MTRTMRLLILSAALVSGCASAPPPKAAGSDVFIGYLTFHVGSKAGDTFKVTTDEITSPWLRLSRVDEGFRGVALRQAIDLRLQNGVVTGSFSMQPIELHVRHQGGKIWLEGLYAGRVVSLFFAEQARDSKQVCGPLHPWISLSNGEPGEDPGAASCDVTSVAALAHMRAYLGEDEALMLIAVMALNGSNALPASVAPPAGRPLGASAPMQGLSGAYPH
jgi:hypothetical protein